MRGAALVSCSCYKKLLFIVWWLQTTGVYSLIVLQAKILKLASLGQNQAFSRPLLPLEAMGENPCLTFSLASSGWMGCPLWLSHSSLCLHGCVDFSSFVCQIFFCPYLIRIHMIACTIHLDSLRKCPHLKILSIITSAKSFFSFFFFAKWSNINSLRSWYLLFGVGAYFSAYHSNLDFSRVSWCFHWGHS